MRSQEVVENGEESFQRAETGKEPTVPLRASAASDVGSDTFGRFEPEFYLPSEEEKGI